MSARLYDVCSISRACGIRWSRSRFAVCCQIEWNRAPQLLGSKRFGSSVPKQLLAEGSAELRRLTWLARRFPSWQEHGGVAIAAVGLLNGLRVVAGFGITWLSTLKRYQLDCKTQRLQSELQRTERQLEALFGPLKAITHATEAGYSSFMVEHSRADERAKRQGIVQECSVLPRAEAVYDSELEKLILCRPRGLEGTRYRQLVACTLQPLNRRAMETVLNHTHFIDGDFPECLYALYAHVIEMDSLLQRWEKSDFTVMFPPTPYPVEVNRWAGQEFVRLRLRQKSLMSELEGSTAVFKPYCDS
mmetsp:Transcript_50080/g.140428  ORF Transcript_50080/g.140428 Transcript_50080/m.140428 type:complete len:303 (-) Transcript_50080:354-1262(-)